MRTVKIFEFSLIIQSRRDIIVSTEENFSMKGDGTMGNFDLETFLHDLKVFLEEMFAALKKLFAE